MRGIIVIISFLDRIMFQSHLNKNILNTITSEKVGFIINVHVFAPHCLIGYQFITVNYLPVSKY